jgi:hypothetical protein
VTYVNNKSECSPPVCWQHVGRKLGRLRPTGRTPALHGAGRGPGRAQSVPRALAAARAPLVRSEIASRSTLTDSGVEFVAVDNPQANNRTRHEGETSREPIRLCDDQLLAIAAEQ